MSDIKKLPVHYGWIVLAAGAFGSFMTLPGQTAGVSVFVDPISSELGASKTSVSLAYALATLAGILPAPMIGRWIDARGPRITGSIIAAGLSLACGYMAVVRSEFTLLVGFAALRGAAIGGLSLVSQQVVNLWFVRRRGVAAAAASLGLAAGAMVFPPATDLLISLYGWRTTYLVLAAIVALTMLPSAAILFRERPETYGLTTDAGLPPPAIAVQREPSFTRPAAMRTGAFWLLCAVGFLTNAVGTALLLNHFSIMHAAGISRTASVQVLSVYAAVQAGTTLAVGALLDRHEPRRLALLPMITLAAVSALPAFGEGFAVAWLYGPGLGVAYGSQQAVGAAGYAQYFGRDHIGAIRGASFILGVGGAAFGPLPFAASLDLTGSYSVALVGSCLLCVLCGASSLIVPHPDYGTQSRS